MTNRSGLLALAGLGLLAMTCSRSTEPTTSGIVAFQVPGCRQGIGRASAIDSCFSYRFEDFLLVDFCAAGNCCPDSNRFLIKCSIRQDTILVAIADTAANLCRCTCRYLLHVQMEGLPLDSYRFVCVQEGASGEYLLYSEQIFRQEFASQ